MHGRFRAGYNLQQLVRVQQLVTVLEPGADDNGSQAAFLGATARALVPAMLLERRDEELRELAALMGARPQKIICCWPRLAAAPFLRKEARIECMHA